jgi:hypothetical protein
LRRVFPMPNVSAGKSWTCLTRIIKCVFLSRCPEFSVPLRLRFICETFIPCIMTWTRFRSPFFMTATAFDDCNDMSFEIARVLIPKLWASLKNCNTLPPLPEEKMWWAFSSWLGCRQFAYDLRSHLVWIFEVMDTATLDCPVLFMSCLYGSEDQSTSLLGTTFIILPPLSASDRICDRCEYQQGFNRMPSWPRTRFDYLWCQFVLYTNISTDFFFFSSHHLAGTQTSRNNQIF